jgi:hypothetical protein
LRYTARVRSRPIHARPRCMIAATARSTSGSPRHSRRRTV